MKRIQPMSRVIRTMWLGLCLTGTSEKHTDEWYALAAMDILELLPRAGVLRVYGWAPTRRKYLTLHGLLQGVFQ
jgi:hypothetical protein